MDAIDLGAGRTAVALVSGGYFNCAILDNGNVKCWGGNANGQLGIGNDYDAEHSGKIPSPPSTAINLCGGTDPCGRTAVALAAGPTHVCAILDNGKMRCWGSNIAGCLGNGWNGANKGLPDLVLGSNTWNSSTGATSGSDSGTSSCIASCSASYNDKTSCDA